MDNIDWSKHEKRIFLKHSPEIRLVSVSSWPLSYSLYICHGADHLRCRQPPPMCGQCHNDDGHRYHQCVVTPPLALPFLAMPTVTTTNANVTKPAAPQCRHVTPPSLQVSSLQTIPMMAPAAARNSDGDHDTSSTARNSDGDDKNDYPTSSTNTRTTTMTRRAPAPAPTPMPSTIMT